MANMAVATSLTRATSSAVVLALLLLMVSLPFADAAACTACTNDDTRKFLKLIAGAFPEVQSAWSAGLSGDYCSNVLGISCDSSAGLITVHLDTVGSSLTGSLPELTSDISGGNVMIVSIYADGMGITGSFPASWSSLSRLQELFLRDNRMSGALTLGEREFPALKHLYLGGNQFSGEPNLPESTFPALEDLELSRNNFDGPLADDLGDRMPKLRFLYLFENSISGTLPQGFQKMSLLQDVYLQENKLVGALPSWTNMIYLSSVNLTYNLMDGTLSASWAQLPALLTVSLEGNNFCGCAPASWIGNPVLLSALNGMDAKGAALQASSCATDNKCGGDRGDVATAPATFPVLLVTSVALAVAAFLAL